LGQGEFLVAEADESDGSFLKLSPTIAVVTNIDREHMDFFNSMDDLKTAFLSFVNKVPFYGISVLCADNGYVQELLPKVQRRFMTYGLREGLDLTARSMKAEGLKSRFEVVLKGRSLGVFEVPLPGAHNVCNSLAAIGTASELEIDMNTVKKALENFSGIQRRFEFKGEVAGIRVFDDYGHHPTEIRATLKAAKEAMAGEGKGRGRLIALFQPHRYTRTRDLFSEFAGAFTDADKVILMDIYPAGEKPLNGVNSEGLCGKIKDSGKDIVHIKDRAEIPGYMAANLREGDVVLTLGAGDVWKTGEEFLKGQLTNPRPELGSKADK
ncbi:MAG TPA: UDP-N-acetylmuramate--L-alanine ligase, partial [Nitrospirae bacterium]|nr:UDP-N-acetylmuramate--L-alanine ligase [Nitrospirota bacterium]